MSSSHEKRSVISSQMRPESHRQRDGTRVVAVNVVAGDGMFGVVFPSGQRNLALRKELTHLAVGQQKALNLFLPEHGEHPRDILSVSAHSGGVFELAEGALESQVKIDFAQPPQVELQLRRVFGAQGFHGGRVDLGGMDSHG